MAARTLVNFQPLPPRERALDRDQIDRDIRQAMAECERKLFDRATRYSVGGYTYGDVEFDLQGHTIIGKLRLERPD